MGREGDGEEERASGVYQRAAKLVASDKLDESFRKAEGEEALEGL